MRPLCGAIVLAGAMIGLGLTAVGFGMRFSGMNLTNPETKAQIGATSLIVLMIVLLAGFFIGLGVTFVGLAYHHEKRERERLREVGHVPGARTVS